MSDLTITWIQRVAVAWQTRRTEEGGLTDDVALMAMLVAVGVVVAAALLAVLTGAVEDLDFSVPGT
jgi:hypothetical protein